MKMYRDPLKKLLSSLKKKTTESQVCQLPEQEFGQFSEHFHPNGSSYWSVFYGKHHKFRKNVKNFIQELEIRKKLENFFLAVPTIIVRHLPNIEKL